MSVKVGQTGKINVSLKNSFIINLEGFGVSSSDVSCPEKVPPCMNRVCSHYLYIHPISFLFYFYFILSNILKFHEITIKAKPFLPIISFYFYFLYIHISIFNLPFIIMHSWLFPFQEKKKGRFLIHQESCLVVFHVYIQSCRVCFYLETESFLYI